MENIKSEDKDINMNIIKNKKDNSSFVTLVIWIVLIAGFITGVLYIYLGGEKSLSIINDWFDKIIQQKSDSNIRSLFLSNITSIMTYISIIFILGFSPVFSFIISIIPFIKGVGVGIDLAYIYINYGYRGIIYEALINIPINIVVMMIIILAVKESIKFSNGISNVIKNKVIINNISLKRYFIKFIIILFMSLMISYLNAIIDFVFLKYLNIL